ncbi:hypothetical protein QUF74_00045 [Candidatus Halobeggiatoa sp. HSG11]|nr:hypothetical protein [Candidatus Halobeggiatoa sp. HSG11]
MLKSYTFYSHYFDECLFTGLVILILLSTIPIVGNADDNMDAYCQNPTLISTSSGNWDGAIWQDVNNPSSELKTVQTNDNVKILHGHTIIVQNIDLGNGNICNEGIITSQDNVDYNTNDITIKANYVYNKYRIISKNGVHGDCAKPAGNGANITIIANKFISETTEFYEAIVKTGDGGNDPVWANGLCPLATCGLGEQIAGNGGFIKIIANNLENNSFMLTGNGGYAQANSGSAIAGNGGELSIETSTNSKSRGILVTGNGNKAHNCTTRAVTIGRCDWIWVWSKPWPHCYNTHRTVHDTNNSIFSKGGKLNLPSLLEILGGGKAQGFSW